MRRDGEADQLVRFYLEFFSISKLILVRKKGGFGYDSIGWKPSSVPVDFFNSLGAIALDLVRYFQYMLLRFQWILDFGGYLNGHHLLLRIPQWVWVALLNRHSTAWSGRYLLSPFGIRLLFLGKRKSVLRVLADYGHSRWISEIGPLGTLYRSSVTSIFLELTTRVDSPDFWSFPWSIYQHVASVDSIYCRAAAALSGLQPFAYGTCMDILKRCGGGFSDDELQPMYPVGRFGFKEEGAGKVRVFAIPNALKQALLRPAHDWCMEVLSRIPMDGTFDQLKPLSRLRKTCCLFSYDLSSATDRFPLNVQAVIISAIWNYEVAFAWVVSGLGTNVFSAPASKDRRVGPKFVCFNASFRPLAIFLLGLFSHCAIM